MIFNKSPIGQTLFYFKNLAEKRIDTDSCLNETEASLLLVAQAVVNAIAIPIILLLGIFCTIVCLLDCDMHEAMNIAEKVCITSMGSLLAIPISLIGIISPTAAINALDDYITT